MISLIPILLLPVFSSISQEDLVTFNTLSTNLYRLNVLLNVQ